MSSVRDLGQHPAAVIFIHLLHESLALHALFKMMFDTAGGTDHNDATIDDFYANGNTAGHHVFTRPDTPSGSFPGESEGQGVSPRDPGNPMPDPSGSRGTVSLGGSGPGQSAPPTGLSGSLDARKVPGGAKFAVSQVRGILNTAGGSGRARVSSHSFVSLLFMI